MKYIDADKIEFHATPPEWKFREYVAIQSEVEAIPAADVEPVIHAYWKNECRSQIMFPDGEAAILIERQCSNCCHWSDKEILKYYLAPSPRCSVCGARMDRKADEE